MEYRKEDFPKIAIYRKPKNRIAFITDFEDGEIVRFSHFPDRPNAYKEGLAFYKGIDGYEDLINIKKLEEFKEK